MEVSLEFLRQQVDGLVTNMSAAEVECGRRGDVAVAGVLASGRHMVTLLWAGLMSTQQPPAAPPPSTGQSSAAEVAAAKASPKEIA